MAGVQVVLVSARDGLLSRLVLGGRATKQDLAKFRQLAFGRRSAPRSDDEMLAKAQEMLEDSGLLALEDRIFAFLYGHSAPLKLLSLVDDCQRLLHQASPASTACSRSRDPTCWPTACRAHFASA